MPANETPTLAALMPPIQTICEALGKTGCYFLSVLELARRVSGSYVDPTQAYAFCVTKGWLGADCFVKDPAAILGHYTGKKWTVRKELRGYKPVLGELVVARFELRVAQALKETVDGHFVVVNGDGSLWDPYFDSRTVRNGQLVSYRLFTEVK